LNEYKIPCFDVTHKYDKLAYVPLSKVSSSSDKDKEDERNEKNEKEKK
jgi:hypothetical protein